MENNDIVDQFNDLDVAENVKQITSTPVTIPLSGPGLHMQNAVLAAKTLAELLGQKKQLGIDTITSSTSVGTNIRTISYDYTFATNNHFGNDTSLAVNTATKFFKGFRANLIVIMEVTSQFQQQGALIINVTNMPNRLWDVLNFNELNIMNLAKFPRRFITLGHNGTYKAFLPWESNLKYWPFPQVTADTVNGDTAGNFYNANGSFKLSIFSPMKIAENVTDYAQIRFYTQLTNIEFCTYSPVSNGL